MSSKRRGRRGGGGDRRDKKGKMRDGIKVRKDNDTEVRVTRNKGKKRKSEYIIFDVLSPLDMIPHIGRRLTPEKK